MRSVNIPRLTCREKRKIYIILLSCERPVKEEIFKAIIPTKESNIILYFQFYEKRIVFIMTFICPKTKISNFSIEGFLVILAIKKIETE